MGGLPEPGPAPTRRHRRGAHAASPTCPRRRADRDAHGGHASTTGISNNKLAMWLFLGSECLLFGGLISTYMLYRGRHSGSLGPDQIYDIPFTSVSSFVLLMSSLTMVLAVSSVARGDVRNTKLWLVITALLGATFVGGQAYEFTSFYREGLGFTTSLFSSSFYTLTGFHGVHVTVGIIMLLSLVGMISTQPGRRRPVRGRRARRPVLALRRHRVDRHLHARLPDPGMRHAMSTETPSRPTSRPTRARTSTPTTYGEGHHGATDKQYILIALDPRRDHGGRGDAQLHRHRAALPARRC